MRCCCEGPLFFFAHCEDGLSKRWWTLTCTLWSLEWYSTCNRVKVMHAGRSVFCFPACRVATSRNCLVQDCVKHAVTWEMMQLRHGESFCSFLNDHPLSVLSRQHLFVWAIIYPRLVCGGVVSDMRVRSCFVVMQQLITERSHSVFLSTACAIHHPRRAICLILWIGKGM